MDSEPGLCFPRLQVDADLANWIADMEPKQQGSEAGSGGPTSPNARTRASSMSGSQADDEAFEVIDPEELSEDGGISMHTETASEVSDDDTHSRAGKQYPPEDPLDDPTPMASMIKIRKESMDYMEESLGLPSLPKQKSKKSANKTKQEESPDATAWSKAVTKVKKNRAFLFIIFLEVYFIGLAVWATSTVVNLAAAPPVVTVTVTAVPTATPGPVAAMWNAAFDKTGSIMQSVEDVISSVGGEKLEVVRDKVQPLLSINREWFSKLAHEETTKLQDKAEDWQHIVDSAFDRVDSTFHRMVDTVSSTVGHYPQWVSAMGDTVSQTGEEVHRIFETQKENVHAANEFLGRQVGRASLTLVESQIKARAWWLQITRKSTDAKQYRAAGAKYMDGLVNDFKKKYEARN